MTPPPPMHPTPPTPPTSSDAVSRSTPFRRRVRLLGWIAATLLLAVGLPLLFFALRGERILIEGQTLRTGWIGLSAVCLGLWSLLATTPRDAIRLSQRVGKRIVLIVSALLGVAALVWLVPLLSAEPLRHRFDGKIWLLGDSPYLTSPAAAADRTTDSRDVEDRPDALDAAAPHQGRTTLTLPVSQAFLAAGRAAEYLLPGDPADRLNPNRHAEPAAWQTLLAEAPWWRRLFAWRCVLAAAYLVTLGEMIAWLRQRDQSVWWATLFAWQPLVLIETVGMGHQDILGVMFLVAGLRRADMGRFRRGAMCLAASAAVQPVALLALPFVLRQAWQHERPGDEETIPPRNRLRLRRVAFWFAGTLALLLLPLATPTAVANLAGAIGQYAHARPLNATLYGGLDWLFLGRGDPGRLAAVRTAGWLLCAAAILGVGTVAWLRRVRPAAGMYAMLVAGLLASPISPPWALIWPLALVPVLGGRGGIVALTWAATAVFHYGGGTFASTWWQAGPVLAAAGAEVLLHRRPERPALAA